MKNVEIKLIDNNTLELMDDAEKGDRIDLTSVKLVDTAPLEKAIEEAKDSVYQRKLQEYKKTFDLEAEKEKKEAVSALEDKVNNLKNQINQINLLKERDLTAKDEEKKNALEKKEAEIRAALSEQIAELNKKLAIADSEKQSLVSKIEREKEQALAKKNQEILNLENEINNFENTKALAIKDIEAKKNEEIEALKASQAKLNSNHEIELLKLQQANKEELVNKDSEIQRLNQLNQEEIRKREDELRSQKQIYDAELKMKDEQIQQYKDFKLKMSTKMVGESLEQHCLTEFNKVRMIAFPNASFGKDNDAKSGSKGDFIYREVDNDGVEILSIMFEMKNENDETATKHKNEHFFKELDKDRTEKKCEYAVLVSMLEADSEYYNQGIVNASYEYPKMYVVRPHMFLTLISLLRQAAQDSYQYKVDLKKAKDANIDVSNFEDKLNKFKEDFTGHYASATKNHNDAIKEIDKAIKNLQDVKESLLKSDGYLDKCNKDMDKVTIKKLTYGNPTMKKMLESPEE